MLAVAVRALALSPVHTVISLGRYQIIDRAFRVVSEVLAGCEQVPQLHPFRRHVQAWSPVRTPDWETLNRGAVRDRQLLRICFWYVGHINYALLQKPLKLTLHKALVTPLALQTSWNGHWRSMQFDLMFCPGVKSVRPAPMTCICHSAGDFRIVHTERR